MKITRGMLWTNGWALLILAGITKGGLLIVVALFNFAFALFAEDD